MDVTRDNFADLMPLIRDSIAQAEFIGFDTEFSGREGIIIKDL
jgi:hypothetical protein